MLLAVTCLLCKTTLCERLLFVRLCPAGIIRRAAEHILAHVDALRQKLKPGEDISVKAYGLELYNEELRDLSSHSAATAAAAAAAAGMEDSANSSSSVRISERPCGNGRCIPEVRPQLPAGQGVVDAEGSCRVGG